VGRLRRIRASSVTMEIVSWTMGIVIVAAITVLAMAVAHHLGLSWP
jgi:hypothetical protein